MDFNLDHAVNILSRTPKVLFEQLHNLPDDWVYQNEGPETWSPFDVVGHLIHGEKTDWIPRTKIIMGNGDKHFVLFDRFAQFKESKGKTIADLLEEFQTLRTANLAELKFLKLSGEDYSKTGIHVEFGDITLKQLLACWVTHDLGHIYQISRVLAKNYTDEIGPWTQYLKVVN